MTSRESWLGGFALVSLLLVPFGQQGSSGNPETRSFYETIQKESKIPILPPAWLFGPIWLVLYVLMAVSIVLWSETAATNAWTWLAIWITFTANVFFNKMWTPLFFSNRSVGSRFGINATMLMLAAVDAALIFLTAVVVLVFLWIDETSSKRVVATILWGIYVLWALYATILSIWIAAKTPTGQSVASKNSVLLYQKGNIEVAMHGDISVRDRRYNQ